MRILAVLVGIHAFTILRPEPARELFLISICHVVGGGRRRRGIIGGGTPGGLAIVEVGGLTKRVVVAVEVATFFVGEATAFVCGPEPAGVGFGHERWLRLLAERVGLGGRGVVGLGTWGDGVADVVHLITGLAGA